jgi:hypothetical protein
MRLQRFRSVTHWLAVGPPIAVLGGEHLATTRFANAPLPHALRVALLCALIPYLLLLLLHFPEFSTDEPAPWEGRNKWPFVCFLVGFGLSWPLRTHFWAVPLLGLSLAQYLWFLSRPRERSCVLLVAGWLLAGLYPLTLAWPNDHRFFLAALIGGAATTLQGVWDVFRYLGEGRLPEEPGLTPGEPTPPAGGAL